MAKKVDPLAGKTVRPDSEEAEGLPVYYHISRSLPPLYAADGFDPLLKGTKVYLQCIRTATNLSWHGVYALEQKEGSELYKAEQVCEVPFQIDALVFDTDTGEQALEISFLPAGSGEWVSQVWDKADLVTGRIDSFCWKKLTRCGVNVSARQLPKLQEFIRFSSDLLPQIGKIPKKPGTTKAGWTGDEYVAAGWKTPDAPVFIGQADPSSGAWERKGDPVAYLEAIRIMVAHNPMFELIAGFYLSGFLLSRLGGSENMVLCLLGDSTLGKTFAAKVCISMKGRPSAFATFDSTDGALKSLMKQSNDGCMVIDEVGTSAMTPEQRARWIYDISSGKERARLRRAGSDFNAAESSTYRYMVLLTGEESLLSRPTADGQRVRYTEIVFNRKDRVLWDSITSGKQADDYLEFFESNHGWLVPLAIEKIRQDVERYRAIYAEALGKMNDQEQNAKASRKHKLLAAAVTGVALLDDVLGSPWDADRLIALTMSIADHTDRDIIEAGAADEQFLNALRSTVSRFRRHLYVHIDKIAVGLEPTSETPTAQPVYGSYSIDAVSESKEKHMFTLDKGHADAWAKASGVDLRRLLDWTEQAGILKTYPNKGQRKPRRDNTFKIGEARVAAYRFEFEVVEEGQSSEAGR